MKQERGRPKSPTWAMVILVSVLFALYLPVVVMFANSFLDHLEPSLRWYREILSDVEMLEALKRSLWVSVANAIIATSIGGMGAIALFRTRFRYAKVVNVMSFVALIMPELVFGLSLLSWFFILGLSLSLWTVVLAHVTFSLSFVLMTMSGRMTSLDHSLDEAAYDLGASPWTTIRKIILPLLKPALYSSFLLSFLLSFDDFLITFFTNGVGQDTLPVRLYAATKMGLSPKLSALATLMFLFSLIIITGLVLSKDILPGKRTR
jgi:spermidine/putrescine transport system permease protein